MKFFKFMMNSEYRMKVISLFVFVCFAFIFMFGYQDCSKVGFSTDGTEGVNSNCSFSGAQIVLNPSSGITSATSVNFSISPAVDPTTTITWTFQPSGGQASSPTTSSTVDKTFGDGTYSVVAVLTKNSTCSTTLSDTFVVSDASTCTPPTGIGGPSYGFVNDVQTFHLDNVNTNCFTGSAQWEMDQEINGVVNTNPHIVSNPNPTVSASYTYTTPGAYQVQVQVANEAYTATHDIVICGSNQIYQNGECQTVCVDPITQQQIPVGSTTQGYASSTGTCQNQCKEITSTCQANGQFNPPIYGSCTNPTNCGGGSGGDFVQAELSAVSNDFSFSQPTNNITVFETTYSYVKVKTGVRSFQLCFDLDVNCNGTAVTCDNANYSNYVPVNVDCTSNTTGATCTLNGTTGGNGGPVVSTLNANIAGYDIFEVTNTANPPNGVIGGPNCHATTHVKQNTALAQFSYVVQGNGSQNCTNGATNYPACTACPSGQFLETNINNPSDKFCATYGSSDGQWCHDGMWSQFWCRSQASMPDAQKMCDASAYAPGWWVPQPDGCWHRNLGSCNNSDGAHCEIYNHVDIIRSTTGQAAYTRQLTLAELQAEGGQNNYTYCPSESKTAFNIPNTCSCPQGSTISTSGPLAGACVCSSTGAQPANNQCSSSTPSNCNGKICGNGMHLNQATCHCECTNARNQVVSSPSWSCNQPQSVWWCCDGDVTPWICHNTGPGPSVNCP